MRPRSWPGKGCRGVGLIEIPAAALQQPEGTGGARVVVGSLEVNQAGDGRKGRDGYWPLKEHPLGGLPGHTLKSRSGAP